MVRSARQGPQHGRCARRAWVETGDRHVVEGAWSGDYDAGAFTTAHVFSGTGWRTRSEGLVLATPTDTL